MYKSIGRQWIALYADADNILYFDSFGVEHIPKEIKKFIGNKNIIANIYIYKIFVLDFLILCEKVKVCEIIPI